MQCSHLLAAVLLLIGAGTVLAEELCPFPGALDPSYNYWKMFMATGKGPNDFGNYDLCNGVPNAKFCFIGAGSLENPTFTSAACLPANCSDAQLAASAAVKSFLDMSFIPFSGMQLLPQCNAYTGGPWTYKAWIMLGVTLGLLGIIVAATVFEYGRDCRRHFEKATVLGYNTVDVPLLAADAESAYANMYVSLTGSKTEYRDTAAEPGPPSKDRAKLSGPEQLIQCFSLKHNIPRMLSVNAERSGETAALNGVRGISMGLVILGHALYWMEFTGFENPEAIFPPNGALSTWTFQIIPSAEFAVDSFFLLSGFLVALAMLKRVGDGKSLNVIMLYLHRYLRLTPSYAFALFGFMYLIRHVSSGPFWTAVVSQIPNCTDHWWTNLLYINNLVPWINNYPRMCIGWTWYLANDMQFFLFSPFLIMIYQRSEIIGVAVVVFLLVASIVALVIASVEFEWYSLPDYSGMLGWGDAGTNVYVKPWFRAPPYLIGILTAMYWIKNKFTLMNWAHRQRKRDRMCRALSIYLSTYVAALALLLFLFYSTKPYYQHLPEKWTKGELVAYTALSRPGWALGLAVLCLLWFSTPADPIAKMLSWPVWEVIARLTYGAYILHPIVLSVVYFSMTQLHRYSPLQLAFNFGGAWLLSYGASAGLFLLVEKPFMNLEILFFKAIGVSS